MSGIQEDLNTPGSVTLIRKTLIPRPIVEITAYTHTPVVALEREGCGDTGFQLSVIACRMASDQCKEDTEAEQ